MCRPRSGISYSSLAVASLSNWSAIGLRRDARIGLELLPKSDREERANVVLGCDCPANHDDHPEKFLSEMRGWGTTGGVKVP
jgi:hypothetical protein